MTEFEIKLEDFKNLIALAFSDQLLSHDEILLISEKAVDAGLSQEEISNLLSNPGQLVFSVPGNEQTKEDQLADAVYLMMSDGKIHEHEYNICLKYAERLELNSTYLNHAIELVKKLWDK